VYDPTSSSVSRHLPQFEAEIKRQRKDVNGRAQKAASQHRLIVKRQLSGGLRAHPKRASRGDNHEIAQTIGNTLTCAMFAVFFDWDIVSYTTCALPSKPNSIDVEAVARHRAQLWAHQRLEHYPRLGVTGWVVSNRQPMYNCDPRLDLAAAHVALDSPYLSMIAVPLIKGDEVLGALTLYSAQISAYEPDHLRLVEAVAKLAADAIAYALHQGQTDASALTDSLTGLSNARARRLRSNTTQSCATVRRGLRC
jgi:transcriptional regulator with GAF, ATPase, and Fis domain